MAGVKRNAILVLRFLDERDAYSPSKYVKEIEVQSSLCLSREDLDAAHDHLLRSGLIQRSGFGPSGLISVTPDGSDRIEEYARESFDLSPTAERVLEYAVRTERQEPVEIVTGFYNALGLTEEKYMNAARELSDRGFISGRTPGAHSPYLAISTTPEGRDAVRRGFIRPAPQQESGVSIGQVGAIIGDMTGGTVQAVGMATGSQISQKLSDPEQLRKHVDEIGNQIVEAVRAELADSGRLGDYLEALEELKQEILSSQPRPGIIRKLTGVLSLTGDIGGTIELILLVGPYLQSLLSLVSGS